MNLLLYVPILNLFFELISGFVKHDIKLSLDLAKALKIRHCIFIQNETNKDMILYFKQFSSAYIPVAYFNDYDLFAEYLSSTGLYMNMGLIFKEESSGKNSRIVEQADQTSKLRNFVWLVFVKNQTENVQNSNLSVPYDSEFIVIQPENGETYKLTEIYEVKNKTFSIVFGRWNHDFGLKISNISFYSRRRNFKKIGIRVLIDERKEVKEDELSIHVDQIISGLVDMMNLTYCGIPPAASIEAQLYKQNIEISYQPAPFDIYKSVDTLRPFFETTVNWYIRYPEVKMRSDYYLQPFHTYIWLVLLFVIIFATMLVLITQYRIQNQNRTFIDNLFLGLETFCNQCGNDKIENVYLRSICILLRLVALISIGGLYGATITSFFAVESFQPPFTNLGEFLRKGEYQFVVNRSQTEIFRLFILGRCESQTSKKIYENTKIIEKDSLAELWKEICYGKYVVYSYDDVFNFYDYPCATYKIPKYLRLEMQTLWLKKNSTFTNIFNKNLIRFQENGISMRFPTFFNNTFEIATSANSDSPGSIEFSQITQILLIPITGILLGAIIIVIEFGKKTWPFTTAKI